jgi:hypothetical protein
VQTVGDFCENALQHRRVGWSRRIVYRQMRKAALQTIQCSGQRGERVTFEEGHLASILNN